MLDTGVHTGGLHIVYTSFSNMKIARDCTRHSPSLTYCLGFPGSCTDDPTLCGQCATLAACDLRMLDLSNGLLGVAMILFTCDYLQVECYCAGLKRSARSFDWQVVAVVLGDNLGIGREHASRINYKFASRLSHL